MYNLRFQKNHCDQAQPDLWKFNIVAFGYINGELKTIEGLQTRKLDFDQFEVQSEQ